MENILNGIFAVCDWTSLPRDDADGEQENHQMELYKELGTSVGKNLSKAIIINEHYALLGGASKVCWDGFKRQHVWSAHSPYAYSTDSCCVWQVVVKITLEKLCFEHNRKIGLGGSSTEANLWQKMFWSLWYLRNIFPTRKILKALCFISVMLRILNIVCLIIK